MKIVIDPSYQSSVIFGKEKYGKLTLLGLVGYFLENNNRKKAAFKFACDCGNEVIKNAHDVKRGKVISCGCYHKTVVSNTGRANTLADCLGLQNLLYYRFITGAKNRGKEVTIDRGLFDQITKSPCHYCGSAPTNQFKHNMACNLKYNGVDRIDSTIHYTPTNVVPCCKHCNWAKNKCSTQEFEEWVTRLVSYRCTKNRAKTVNGEIPNTVLNS